MTKNIVLLSDGTGNSSAKIFKTNVWRLFQAINLRDPDRQVAYYDDGVGTSSFKLFALLGGAFGFGLRRNVLDIYCFCCRNYRPGDRIYGFGFSRGAFTIRVVAGFIARIGLVEYDGSEAHLLRDARIAYREYRKARNYKAGLNFLVGPLRALRDFVSHRILHKPSFDQLHLTPIDKIHFLGVWDTVAAYGGPVEEITRAIDYWYWPLSMPDQFMNHKVNRACHALALEDERDSFMPLLWDERYVRQDNKLHPAMAGWTPPQTAGTLPDIDRERISQVWFVGVHSDIGGGYPQDGLSYYTLRWMMERAHVYGLEYLPAEASMLAARADPNDKLNDSRRGFAGYYRYRPRKLADIYAAPPYKLSIGADLRHMGRMFANRPDPEDEVKAELASGSSYIPRPPPRIHQAALDRVAGGTDGYSPIVLPEVFDIVSDTGAITSNIATAARKDEARSRATRQEKVWDWVWARRVTYFATVFASLYLLALPWIENLRPGRGAGSPFEFVVPLIDVAAMFLPDVVAPWLDAFRRSPGRFLLGLVLVFGLMSVGGSIQVHIRDVMRRIWRSASAPAIALEGAVYRLRSSGPYRAFFYALKHWILPGIVALLILLCLLWVGLSLLSRVSFGLLDATGQVCAASQHAPPVSATPVTRSFATGTLCTSTGYSVQRNKSYRLTVEVRGAWVDTYKDLSSGRTKGIETGPEGFGFEKMTAPMILGLPIRRQVASNWFLTILRVGNKGFGEINPKFERTDPAKPDRYTATFKARRGGEVFVYVNDAVIGLPGYFDRFYRSNKGNANLTLELLPD